METQIAVKDTNTNRTAILLIATLGLYCGSSI